MTTDALTLLILLLAVTFISGSFSEIVTYFMEMWKEVIS
jgi:hypothetical protein